jgi:hypothetical protein
MGSWKGWKRGTGPMIKCVEKIEIELQKFTLQKQDIKFRLLNSLTRDPFR